MKSRLRLALAASPLFALFNVVNVACSGTVGGSELDPSHAPPPLGATRVAEKPAIPAEVPAATAPPPAESLSVAVEGRCDGLDVEFAGATTFVRHGHLAGSGEPRAALVFARVTDDAIDDDARLTRGLHLSDDEAWRPMHVLSMGGTWPDDARLTMFNEGGERVGTLTMEYAWKGDRWKAVPARPPSDDAYGVDSPWANGSTLWLHSDGAYPVLAVAPRGAAPRPDFSALRVRGEPDCQFDPGAVLAHAGGELLLAGRFCGIFPTHVEPMYGRRVGEAALARWTPGRGAALEPIPKVARRASLRLTGLQEASPTATFLFGSIVKNDESVDEAYIARLDGNGWARIDAPFKVVRRYSVEADGTLWAWADRSLYRRPPTGEWEKAPVEEIQDVAWTSGRPAWLMTSAAILRREDAGTWTSVAVPKPAFSEDAALQLDALKLSPAGDLWVRAKYTEQRAQWTKPEERRALLHFGHPGTRRPARCESGAPGEHSLLAGWPPPASESCATPFAVLVRVSKSAPAAYDYPQTRAALRGHTELDGAEFADVEIDGRRYFGAKPASLAQGRAAVEIVGKKVQGSRPELVCLAPKVKRPLPLDLTTGAVVAPRPVAMR